VVAKWVGHQLAIPDPVCASQDWSAKPMLSLFTNMVHFDAEDANDDIIEPEPLLDASTSGTAELAAALKSGAALFAALDVQHRPIAPFINRPKLPRAHRQKLLDKLVGEHLCLAAILAGTGDNAAAAAADEELRKASFEKAIAQEAELYAACSSAQIYQQRAAKMSALDWHKVLQAKAEEEYEAALIEERKRKAAPTKTAHGLQGKRHKGASSKFQSSDGKDSGEGGGRAQLVEEDLDWAAAAQESAKAAEERRRRIRRKVVAAMESVEECKGLSAEDKVRLADRCCDKAVLETEEGLEPAHTSLQRLVGDYARYLAEGKDHASMIDNVTERT